METRTDRPQIDTSRMNNDDPRIRHSSSPCPEIRPSQRSAFRETRFRSGPPTLTRRSGHRTDRPSLRRHQRAWPREWERAWPREWERAWNPRARTSLTPRSPRTRTSPTSLGTRTRTSPRKRGTCPNQASPMLTRRSITKTLSRFSISTKPLSIATDMTELDTLDWPRLQLHDAGSLVYAYTDIPSMAWSAMRTPRSTTATTPWRRIASIR